MRGIQTGKVEENIKAKDLRLEDKVADNGTALTAELLALDSNKYGEKLLGRQGRNERE